MEHDLRIKDTPENRAIAEECLLEVRERADEDISLGAWNRTKLRMLKDKLAPLGVQLRSYEVPNPEPRIL